MKINSRDFRVGRRAKVKLEKWPTKVKPYCKSKEQYQKLLGERVEKLGSLHSGAPRHQRRLAKVRALEDAACSFGIEIHHDSQG